MDEPRGTITFYVNGTSQTIGFIDPFGGAPYSRVTIGYGQDPLRGHVGTFFGGLIDEVAIYNDLLTDADIQKHYQNGLAGLGYITEEPAPPVATDDAYTTDEDMPLIVDAPGVLANDFDDEGDPLSAILETGPSEGALTLNGDGSFEYTPGSDFNGIDSFTYKAFDGIAESIIATVTITVNAVNDAPVTQDDYYTIDEDTALDVAAPGVFENDYDADGDILVVDSVTNPLHGLFAFYLDGSFSYTPDQEWHGITTFEYRVSDGTLVSNLAIVTIEVFSVNDAPVGVDDSYTIDEDTVLQVEGADGALANDTDADGDPLEAVLETGPTNGVLTLNLDGSFTYTPNANFFGTDSFTYRASDGVLDSDITTVTITVNPVNDAPVAVTDYVTIDEDTVIIIDVLANDYDVDGDLIEAVWMGGDVGAMHGQLSFYWYEAEPGVFRWAIRYQPHANWYGTLPQWWYGIQDSSGATATGLLYITVNPVNDAPVAVDDFIVTDEDTLVIIDFMANDYDIDGSFSWDYVTWNPTEIHGELELVHNYEVEPGVFRTVLSYTPDPDWHGASSSISYGIRDSAGLTSSAQIYITVNPVNDPPVGVDDSYTIDEDISLDLSAPGLLGNDFDIEGDVITLVVVTVPSHGSGSIGADGSFSYTPNQDWYGTDSMTYQVYDGADYSGIVTVTINVNAVNDAPVAVDDYVVTDEDTPVIIDFMANDNDIDDSFSWDYVTWNPTEIHGELELVHNYEVAPGVFRTVLSYTPDPDWHGASSSISYGIRDTGDLTSSAHIFITVNPVNDAPVAVDDYVVTDEDTPVIIDMMANDYDFDSASIDAAWLGYNMIEIHGTLDWYQIERSPGVFRWGMIYTPNPNWHGSVTSISYGIRDSEGAGASARVYITVTPVNDVPLAHNDAYTIDEDNVLHLDALGGVVANDVDIDGDSLQAILVSGPASGTLTLNADGSFTYDPGADFWGTDSFTYYITDGFLDSNVATVTLIINSVNDAPVAVDDAYTTDEDVPITVIAPGLLANDFDVEGDAFHAILVDAPLHGSVLLETDGSLNYIPDSDWWGVDTMTYQAFDGSAYGNVATVTITVNYVNTPPTAVADAFTTEAGVPLVVTAPGVLANDVDIDGDPLEAILIDGPMFGALLFYADGSFTYTPAADWCGVDTFSYNAFDSREYSDIAVVTITVVDVTPPVTTIYLVGDAGEYYWYYSDVEVTLSATDDCSGVETTAYSLDGTTWMLYIDPIILMEPGEYTIQYNSTDFAGNVEDTKTAIVKISKPTHSYVSGSGKISEADGSKGYFTFVVRYKYNGALRGIAMYVFRESGYKYTVWAREWLGMVIDGDHAILEAKGTVMQYDYETRCRKYFKDFYLRIEIWDNGKGQSDVFQIRIFDESGELFHEAGFDPPGDLLYGNIRIRTKSWKCWCRFRSKNWWS
jgi:VCBS repeat-containing protein